MSRHVKHNRASRRFAPATIIFAVLGLLLFVYFVRRTGVAEIIEGIKRLGINFLLVLVVSGVRPVVRALAWMRCFEAPYRLRLRDALRAYLNGDAFGNVMPLGIVVSEPTKATLVRERVPLVAGLSTVAVENLFYSLSAVLFIFAGTAALLLRFPLSNNLRLASIGTLVSIAVIILIVYLIIRQQWRFLSGALEYFYVRGIGRRVLGRGRARVAALEESIYGFYARNRARFLPILLLETSFHLAGIIEVYLTLHFISHTPPTWFAAFVLESVNRMINIIFKIVPLRVGVDEAGTGLFTQVLQFGTTSGVTLAIIRKARVMVWTAVGVALLIHRGLSWRAVISESPATNTDEAPPTPPPKTIMNYER